ncbi:SMC-Scp complex subunit ScpB [Patescibacteria group bacterium]|nr:SMC-Scp complex subunit ScpB [Patescibacteria group bacterium]
MLTPPAAVHALLFTASGPLEKKQIETLLALDTKELDLALHAVSEFLKGSGVALLETDAEVELRTSPEAEPIVKKLRENERARDLGKAGLETLAIIAYQEGATRSEIDWLRGVNSSTSLRTLLMRGLIEGREDPKDKRRARYRLTTEALAHLGIRNAGELPRAAELRPNVAALIEREAPPKAVE